MTQNLTGGHDFSTASGLKTGQELEDLVEKAEFAPNSGMLDQITISQDGDNKAQVADEGVDTTQLADGSVTVDKLHSSVYPIPITGLPVIPCFLAHQNNVAQSISGYVNTKIVLGALSWDTFGDVDLTNNRFVCSVAGVYRIGGYIQFIDISRHETGWALLYFNGELLATGNYTSTRNSLSLTVDTITCGVSALVKLEVGDYVELWGRHEHNGSRNTSPELVNTRFEGNLVSVNAVT